MSLNQKPGCPLYIQSLSLSVVVAVIGFTAALPGQAAFEIGVTPAPRPCALMDTYTTCLPLRTLRLLRAGMVRGRVFLAGPWFHGHAVFAVRRPSFRRTSRLTFLFRRVASASPVASPRSLEDSLHPMQTGRPQSPQGATEAAATTELHVDSRSARRVDPSDRRPCPRPSSANHPLAAPQSPPPEARAGSSRAPRTTTRAASPPIRKPGRSTATACSGRRSSQRR